MRTRGAAHDETKERILEVARRQVLAHGHDKLSLRAIAREVGFSAPSLYEYFPDKQAIVDALSARIAASLRAALRKPSDLIGIGVAYVAWARRHPQDFMLLFAKLGSRRRGLAQTAPADSPYRIVLEDAGGDEQIAYALWATAHGMAMLQLTHLAGFAADFDAADRRALTALVDGFRAR